MTEEGGGDHGLPNHQHALREYLQALLDEVDEVGPEEGAETVPADSASPATPPVSAEGGKAKEEAGALARGGMKGRASPTRQAPASAPPSGGPSAPARGAVASAGEQQHRQAGATPGRARVAERTRLPQQPMPPVAPAAEAHAPAAAQQQGGGQQRPPAQDHTPAWARPFFQVLILHVGAIRLAVPLIKLHRVVAWEDPEEVQPTVGQPRWMHGLLDHRGRYVQVVDTAELVLPEERRPPVAERRKGKIIIVGDGRWGLACRDVGEVLRLRPEQVQWRTAAGQRRWLAGTVREHLCALVDTDAFAELLEQEGSVGGTLASPAADGQNTAAGAR
ncbi:MAG: chemotaxis protein CheW [Halorhodospira sp.]